MDTMSKFIATFEGGEPLTIEAYSWRSALDLALEKAITDPDRAGLVSLTVED